jgi:energy-coupling factor transporter transmembrane protein EcfT
MLLALIPAATVMPTSKNLGFVAVGAYGLIATFVAGLITRPSRLPGSLIYRIPAWVTCALLILAHVPGAIAGRALAAGGTALALEGIDRLTDVGNSPDAESKRVIIVNAPCSLPCAYAPSYRAYHHQPLPRSIRMLGPGCTSFDAQRTDDKTLVIESKAPDIFSCDDVGPIHAAYAFRTLNLHVAAPRCKKGDIYNLGEVTVEVLQMGSSDLPSRVEFRFDTSLDSPDFRWFQFDWPTFAYRRFKVPAIGQCVTLSGPS